MNYGAEYPTMAASRCQQLNRRPAMNPPIARTEDHRSRFRERIVPPLWLLALLLIPGLGASRVWAEEGSSPIGLLVMAHGGSTAWNRAVEDAVAPLRLERPVAIAFGMADRGTLQQAVRSLEEQGVSRIAVVRLFISGHSFRHQTEYLLGLRPDPPARFVEHHGHGQHIQPSHGAGSTGPEHAAVGNAPDLARQPIERRAQISLSVSGLDEDSTMTVILGERAAAMSRKPEQESVLLLAHGVEDDQENRDGLSRLQAIAENISRERGFASVRVETLREDWRDKRAHAEQRIHEYVSSEAERGRRVLVVPVRVFGFGPYREVLTGLRYTADENGLLPHPAMTRWIERQYTQVCKAGGWEHSIPRQGGVTPVPTQGSSN